MEFLKANFLNTTTMLAVTSNTSTASNIFNRDPLYSFYTDGENSDLTTTRITVTFDATMSVSRIALTDMNFKEFRLYHDGVTASTFALTGGDTTASSYTGNTDTDKFFRFPTTSCASITLECTKTITANQEKVLGLFFISDLNLALTQIPSAKAYKPKIVPKQIVHKLSDGGTRIHTVRKKWELSFKLENLSESQRDSLYDIYNTTSEFNFCPFGTTTSWDAINFECVWDGPFDFYEYSDNATSAGFTGSVSLKETSI